MATYVNNLRLKEIATGAESGTWGTSTNTNLELIADAFGSGTEAITTNADTHSTTVADGSADEGRAIYMKYTGTLDSACTISLLPNTINKFWIIENATSGSQNIIISQGSGANITIGNGKVAAIFTDGAGAGAAVLDAFADLELSTTLTVAGASTLAAATLSGNVLVGLTTAEALYTLTPKLQVETTGSDAGLSAWRNSNDAGGAYLFLGSSRGTALNADTIVQDDDALGSIMFMAADGTDRGNAAASIIANIDGTPGGNDTPGRLQFNTSADGSGAPTTRMTILSDGKFGIGITPTHNFNLSSAGGVEARFASTDGDCSLQISSDTDEGQDSKLSFYSGTSERGSIVYDHHTTAASQKMEFHVGDNAVEAAYFAGDGTLWLTNNLVINATKKFYLDGGSDTYIVESSSNVMDFYTSAKAMSIDGNQKVDISGLLTVTETGSSGHWAAVFSNNYNSSSDVSVSMGYANSSGRNSGINLTMDDANSGEYLVLMQSGGTQRMKLVGDGSLFGIGADMNKQVNFSNGANGLANVLHFEASTDVKWGIYAYDRSNSHYCDVSIGANLIYTDESETRVGINTSAPAGMLHVKDGDTVIAPNSSADNIVASQKSGDCGISILSGNSNCVINFGDEASADDGSINYIHGDRQIRFKAADTSFFWIAADGFYLGSNVGDNQFRTSSAGSGSTTMYIGNESITTSSDRRLKTNIVDSSLDAVDVLNQLRVTEFDWDDPSDTSFNNRNARGTWTGLIAQEVVEHLPFAVNAPRDEDKVIDYDSDSTWSITPLAMCGVLVKAVQELSTRIEVLEAQLDG